MQVLLNLTTTLLPLLYALAAVNYLVFFVHQAPFAQRTCTLFLAGTCLLHFAYLLLRVVHFERSPIVGLPELTTVIALAVAGVYLYVERIQGNMFTGAFIVPMVALLQFSASATMPETVNLKDDLLSSPLFGLHAVLAVLGYSAFAVGAVYGVMFLLLYRALKRKTFGLLFNRLPSLDQLANMGFWATFLGWLFLSATILLGVLMSLNAFPNFYRDAKFIGTVMVWMVYGASVTAYFGLRWRGARLVYISLVGFVFALIAVMGSTYIWDSFHSFQA
ncbi:MAG: cytochrome c biogenesis protein CcsA [Myxococcota bacterium]